MNKDYNNIIIATYFPDLSILIPYAIIYMNRDELIKLLHYILNTEIFFDAGCSSRNILKVRESFKDKIIKVENCSFIPPLLRRSLLLHKCNYFITLDINEDKLLNKLLFAPGIIVTFSKEFYEEPLNIQSIVSGIFKLSDLETCASILSLNLGIPMDICKMLCTYASKALYSIHGIPSHAQYLIDLTSVATIRIHKDKVSTIEKLCIRYLYEPESLNIRLSEGCFEGHEASSKGITLAIDVGLLIASRELLKSIAAALSSISYRIRVKEFLDAHEHQLKGLYMLIDDLNKALRDLETVYRFLKGKGSTIDLYADMLSGIPSENLDRCYSTVAPVVIEKIDNRVAILKYFHSCLGLDKALDYLNLVLRDLEKTTNHVVEYVTMFNSLKSVQKELQYTRRALLISFISLIVTFISFTATLLWYLGLFR